MVDYIWKIRALSAINQDGIPPNTVNEVHWTLTGFDGDHSAEVSTFTQIEYNQDATFVPMQQLTEDQVISWVENTMGEARVNEFKDHVAKLIQEKIGTPSTFVVPPWQQ
jgi:hypothetical protein